jgi:pyruvate dehydrogenase E2 component (dihydrolipoamide acetyltransferase)
MAELTMPKMGDAMEEGTLLQWFKKEGEHVKEEEPVAEISTEKASIEIPSYQSGVLTQILVQEGQTVPVGTPIALIQVEGEPPVQAVPAPAAKPTEAAPAPPAQQTQATPPAGTGSEIAPEAKREPATEQKSASEAPPAASRPRQRAAARPESPPAAGEENERVKASPLARKIAAERGIDLSEVRGTGPGGRIVEADLEEQHGARPEQVRPAAERAEAPPARGTAEPAPASAQAPPVAEERELSAMRRTIARRLLESKQTIPHFYVTSEIDMEAAMALREQLHAADPERPKIPPDALVVRACALALRKFPTVNSQLVENKLRLIHDVNVGVAVALPDGLIVPVVRQADQKSVTQIADEIRQLAERARAGQLKPAEFSGGTFTISNLGMYDVESFSAIINPPEAAILAVGSIAQAPVVKKGELAVGLRMKVTISADHRIVDGAVAAQFLQEVKRLLQNPLLLV